MRRSTLIIIAGMVIGHSSVTYAIHGDHNSIGYSTSLGSYYEYKISGYNIQPNRPGIWDAGCRTDNYYCTAQLERCRGYQGVTFVEPTVLKQHR